jgi:transaldolase
VKFFVDSADLSEIRQCVDQGIITGVTTSAAGRPSRDQLAEICQVCSGPVTAEVAAADPDGMIREARDLAKIAPNLVVQVPLTAAGVQLLGACTAEGIKTRATHCVSPVQALVAAKAGASYISPLVAPADDRADDTMDLIRKIAATCRDFQYKTELLVASIRSANELVEAALWGAAAATAPFAVLRQFLRHPLADGSAATCPGSASTSTR